MSALNLPALNLRQARWLAPALAVLMLALGALPGALPLLDWNRGAIMHGQWYRLLSAHLVHLGGGHLLLNALALLLLGELFWQQLSSRMVAALLLVSALGVSLGLLWTMPELWRYAGLSGVLHGAWAGSALLLLNQGGDDQKGGTSARFWWALALLLLAAKLVLENFVGFSASAPVMHAPVILPSHALGALAGLSYASLVGVASRARFARAALAAVPRFD